MLEFKKAVQSDFMMIDSEIDDDLALEGKKRFGVSWKVTEVPIDKHYAYTQMFKYEVKYKKDDGTVTEVNQKPTQKLCKKAILTFLLDHLGAMASAAAKHKSRSERKIKRLRQDAIAAISNRQKHYTCDMMAFGRFNNLILPAHFNDRDIQ